MYRGFLKLHEAAQLIAEQLAKEMKLDPAPALAEARSSSSKRSMTRLSIRRVFGGTLERQLTDQQTYLTPSRRKGAELPKSRGPPKVLKEPSAGRKNV
jgi:hypothetical protein